MEGLGQPILNGILLGGLYAVIAIGMSTMFGIVKLVNLAHGDLMILSAYLLGLNFKYYQRQPMIHYMLQKMMDLWM